MNRSFQQFVLRVERPEQVRDWEQATGSSVYEHLRTAVVLAFVVVGGFLFLTQPDVLSRGIAFLTGIVAGVGALIQILGYFRGGKSAPAAS